MEQAVTFTVLSIRAQSTRFKASYLISIPRSMLAQEETSLLFYKDRKLKPSVFSKNLTVDQIYLGLTTFLEDKPMDLVEMALLFSQMAVSTVAISLILMAKTCVSMK